MPATARQAFAAWSASYDTAPNPLIALETRVMKNRLPDLHGLLVVDVAAGTGRWSKFARGRGAGVVAVDLCGEMLRQCTDAVLVQADMLALPLRDNVADVAICSLALGYVADPARALSEMARVARRVIVSDLHADAVRSGWTRSFRSGGRRVEIPHRAHSLAGWNPAGFQLEWSLEAQFGPEELEWFSAADREELYDRARGVNAIQAASWVRK